MTRSAVVFRCEVCGAPLSDVLVGADLGAVVCKFCGAENHPQLVGHRAAVERVARITAAAKEARQMARDMESRITDASARVNAAVVARDYEAASAAFEGLIRMSNIGSYHMLSSMDPDDPMRIDALEELDRGIADAVAKFRNTYINSGDS